MVADQRPAIEAEARHGQAGIVLRLLRQGFQAAAEVIAQQADQAADEGQFAMLRGAGRAEFFQRLTQALEEPIGGFPGAGLEHAQRPGAQYVEAPAFGSGAARVQQHRAGRMADALEPVRGVGSIGQGVQRADGHGLFGTVKHKRVS